MPTPSPAINPANGSSVSVPMGQLLVIEITFDNPSSKLRSYDLVVSGAAMAFAEVESSEVHVAPFETGVARITFAPTGNTTPDDYPLEIAVMEDGEAVDPPGRLSLYVEVEYAEVVDHAAEQARAEAAAEELRQQEAAALALQQAEELRQRQEAEAQAEALRVAAAAEEQARLEAERVAAAEKQALLQAEAEAKAEADRLAAAEAAEQARVEAEAKAEAARLEAEAAAEKARIEAESKAEADRLAAAQAAQQEEQAKTAENQARLEAEAKAEAERFAAAEAEQAKATQEEEAARLAAQQKAEAAKQQEQQRAAAEKEAEAKAEQEQQKLAKIAAEKEAEQQAAAAQAQAEAAAAKLAAETAAAAKLAEEAAETQRIEEAKRLREEEERAKQEAAQAEAKRLADEEAAEAKRRAQAEAARQAEIEAAEDARRAQAEAAKQAEIEAAEAKKRAADEQRREAEEARKREMAERADQERAKLEAEANARAAEEAAEAQRRAQSEAERQAREEQARIDAAKKLKEAEAEAAEFEQATKPDIAVVDGSQFLKATQSTPEKQALVGDFKADRVITDAKNGTQILVKPGETVLVKFTVRHDVQKGQRPASRTFRLQHNRALKEDWIDIVVPTLNVKPNGTGELAVMLRPPLDAEPANYPFSVEVGVQGQVFVPTQYVLTVQPVPVVQVEAEKREVKIGPFGRDVPFKLRVASAGNSETAYRLAVKDPKAADRDDLLQHEDLYEQGHWQYNFDRELADLVSQSSDGKPTPQSHHLTARRRGIWWFGFVEKHPMRVAAVPVTDPNNSNNVANTVELVARRWRLIPMAAFLFWPLVLLFWMFFTGGSTTVEVMNAYPADDRRVIVMASSMVPKEREATIPLQLRIDRSSFLKPKLFLTQGKNTRELPLREGQAITLNANDYVSNAQLVLKDFMGRTLQTTDITALGHRTDDLLKFAGIDPATQQMRPLTAAPPWMSIGEPTNSEKAGNSVVATYNIRLPASGGRRIYLLNSSSLDKRLSVLLTITKRPNAQYFSVADFGQEESKVETLQSQAFAGPLFLYKGGPDSIATVNALPEEQRTWELVSTSGPERVMRFVLSVGDSQ